MGDYVLHNFEDGKVLKSKQLNEMDIRLENIEKVISLSSIQNQIGNTIIDGQEESQVASIRNVNNRFFKFNSSYPYIWLNEEIIDGNRTVLTFYDCNNLIIDGLAIDCDINNQKIGKWSALRFVNCHNITLKNLKINGFKWCGIAIENTCSGIQILSSCITKCRFNIYDEGYETIIANNIITDELKQLDHEDPTNLFFDGIMAFGNGTVINGNSIYDIGQSGIFSSNCKNISIIGNTLVNVHNKGIDFGNDSEVIDAGITISGNIIKVNYSGGINITNMKRVTINNNIITSNSVGIIFEKNTSDVILSANCITNTHIGDGELGENRGVSCGLQIQNLLSYGNNINAEVPFFIDDPERNIYNIDLTPNHPLVAKNKDGQVALNIETVGNPIINVGNASDLFFKTNSGADINLHCKNIIAQQDGSIFSSIWLTNFLRLPQVQGPTEGSIWYDATDKKIKVRVGSENKTLSFD